MGLAAIAEKEAVYRAPCNLRCNFSDFSVRFQGSDLREFPYILLAERVRFELTSPLRGCRFSRPVHSTALPPLRFPKNQPVSLPSPRQCPDFWAPSSHFARSSVLEHFGQRATRPTDTLCVPLVEDPLLYLFGSEQPCIRQNPQVFARRRLGNLKLLGNQDAAHPIMDKVAILLRPKVLNGIFEPLQDENPLFTGKGPSDFGSHNWYFVT
jgi:hypothetical protein